MITNSTNTVVFDYDYYSLLMADNGYNALEFEKIDFSIGTLTKEDLQRRWLCHHLGNTFADDFSNHRQVIVSTGFGLSGTPHIGTLSQILKSITLQQSGIPVQIVLGDLDAYNGKAISLKETLNLEYKYKKFITALGFKPTNGSILRSQYEQLEVLRTSYLIGHFMDEKMFQRAEEDLHTFYSSRGKVDSNMSYRRKLSLNLMIADFIHLSFQGYQNVMVMLGVDEHKYVRFGQETLKRMNDSHDLCCPKLTLSAIYSPIIKGLYGYPKMSKSFPGSGINVGMEPAEIKNHIITGEGYSNKPENNVIYQIMSSVSYYNPKEIEEIYNLCAKGGKGWLKAKEEYAECLIDICSKWPK